LMWRGLLCLCFLAFFNFVHADPPGPGWKLSIEDNFDTFNDKLWTKGWSWYKNGVPQPPVQTKGNDPDCYFAPENVYVQNGNLVILNERRTNQGLHYTSGIVNSIKYNNSQGFEQQYGYFEARIWGSPGGIEGMCPAFWLPNTLNNGDDGHCELDIVEVPGGSCCGVGKTAYWTLSNGTNGDVSGKLNSPSGYWGDTYHIWGVLWQSDSVCWYTDNVQQFCTKQYIPTTPAYMVFDNEIGLAGDDWAGSPNNTAFPQYMHVDWVRAWHQ